MTLFGDALDRRPAPLPPAKPRRAQSLRRCRRSPLLVWDTSRQRSMQCRSGTMEGTSLALMSARAPQFRKGSVGIRCVQVKRTSIIALRAARESIGARFVSGSSKRIDSRRDAYRVPRLFAMYSPARMLSAMIVSVVPAQPPDAKQLASVTKTFGASQH